MINIYEAKTEDEIANCFSVFKALRPHLTVENFVPQVKRQQAQGYKILALSDNGIVQSIIGYRQSEFLAWGEIIYIDDLSTAEEVRGKGYAGKLLDQIINKAKSLGLQGVHLDTGYARHFAHRLYLNKGLNFSSHHLSITFS
ncbi:GNAT family N-acetyltransferase [Colwellia echini]|uniref:GNAT family N-acetyltransferase n=1 Tax=Colwellia echini TaxID=1982103 RepID=A0ABY3MWH2_9GAMM|nr:GNAT family N-acetyltransferase [Colwellia echini]TYK65392.1 GNAT family N-acetyltransferase [Colwellia echini]